MAQVPDIYTLSRSFWDYSFRNPEKVRPTHAALFFFAVDLCNRLGWKEKFGLPTTMAKEAIGIGSYNTYVAAFRDLVDWGFFTLIEKSKNQYSSNIIALSDFDKATDKATTEPLDKALMNHVSKQLEYNKTNTQSYPNTNKGGTRLTPPQIGEIILFFENEKNLDPEDSRLKAERFFLFYDSKNWMVGKNKMTNWKSAATRSLKWAEQTIKSVHPSNTILSSEVSQDQKKKFSQ